MNSLASHNLNLPLKFLYNEKSGISSYMLMPRIAQS